MPFLLGAGMEKQAGFVTPRRRGFVKQTLGGWLLVGEPETYQPVEIGFHPAVAAGAVGFVGVTGVTCLVIPAGGFV